MKLFLLLLLCLTGLAPTGGNLLQFGAMIKHKTGKSPFTYDRYGCYCGWGGSKQPVDATDRCCHAHDCCYKRISSGLCRPKLVTYNYHTWGSQITCGSGTVCQMRSCECDKRAAECFQRTARSYNARYKNYPSFLCKGRTPSC
ncbi:basic phospholipase A2-like [Numenius arquata]|uniref:basic phospholipase A2-like n=1 Tax=Numenius arquata TaxID=31919 RepID=UPI003D3073B5